MPQIDDSLLDEVLQKLRDEESEEDPLKYLLEKVLNELLEKEMTEHLKADKYERVNSRCGHRNGYRKRDLHTRVGTLELRVPRDREGNFSTEIFEKYQRSEKSLVLALQEAYLQGVSTRKTKKVTEKLCGTEFSKDQVSRLTKQLDEKLEDWRSRSLDGEDEADDSSGVSFPYLVIDATYEKVRENGQIRDRAVLMVVGIDDDGYRQFLGTYMKRSESEISWSEVFTDLINRGVDPQAVEYIVSDNHKGMKKAIGKFFEDTTWCWCHTHFQRASEAKVDSTDEQEKLHTYLRTVLNSPNEDTAKARARLLINHYRDKYSDLADWLEENIVYALSVFKLPKKHRKRLRTNNSLERFNGEIKRRTKVVRIFPNRASCLRLVTALCMEQSEEWVTGRRYINKEALEDFLSEESEEEKETGVKDEMEDRLQREVVYS